MTPSSSKSTVAENISAAKSDKDSSAISAPIPKVPLPPFLPKAPDERDPLEASSHYWYSIARVSIASFGTSTSHRHILYASMRSYPHKLLSYPRTQRRDARWPLPKPSRTHRQICRWVGRPPLLVADMGHGLRDFRGRCRGDSST